MEHVDTNFDELPMSDVISSIKQNFIKEIEVIFELFYI